jgi:hypothetical protein
VCLQEVESLLALRRFNEEHLHAKYRYAFLVDSRDSRLSRALQDSIRRGRGAD